MSRNSIVGKIRVISSNYSSVVKVGDSTSITPHANIFALQKRRATFTGDQGNLNNYSIYERPLEMPVIDQTNQAAYLEREPNTAPIYIGHINIIGLSASAVLQIGSTGEIFAESRIKHVRDFTS